MCRQTMSNKGGFWGSSQGNQGRTFYDKPYYNDRSGLYVPPGSWDTAITSSAKMSMEYMMKKLLKGVEATNSGVTTMKSEFSTLNQLVSSHSTSIKQLEQ